MSTLCDEKVDHGTFLETVLLANYDNILKCHLENVTKKCLQNKSNKNNHNRANRNTFISKTTVNFIIAIIAKLMKEEISNLIISKEFQKKFQISKEFQIKWFKVCIEDLLRIKG